MHPSCHPCRLAVIGLILLGAAVNAFAQSVTSSGLAGRVADDAGRPLAEARIIATHEPTGTPYLTTTDDSGRYRITGMQVGGPYTIEVTRAGYRSQTAASIDLPLGQARTFNFGLGLEGADIFEFEAFEVIASVQDYIFTEDHAGSATTLDLDTITNLPTISRSIADIARLDPRVNIYDRDSGQISAGGKNTRYNSLLIDGVPTNDSFGLSDSGLPALKQPFSLESLSEVSIRLSPYTVENAGFTGASISAVTRSGTNRFSGSVFGYYRNDSMVGDLYQVDSDIIIPFTDFTEYTIGATFAGPIIRNKLFFFMLYEKVEETVLRGEARYIPDPAEIERIANAGKLFHTPFDVGVIREANESVLQDDKLLLKLDWNVSQAHRLSARYNQTIGKDPRFRGSPNTSFDSSWWTIEYLLDDYTVELFSNWTNDFSSELRVSLKNQSRDRLNNSQLPDITIQSIANVYTGPDRTQDYSSISFGATDISLLDVQTTVVHWKGSLFMGRHELMFGVQLESSDNDNMYLRYPYGRWRFDNMFLFERAMGVGEQGTARVPSDAAGFDIEIPAGNYSGGAEFRVSIASAFIQNDWSVNNRLKLSTGLRIDYPMVNHAPPSARASVEDNPRSFAEVFGISNQNTIDGNHVLQPRAGFNYALREDRSIQLRGGAGLFFGTAPHVWLSSTYIDNGVTKLFYNTGTRQDSPAVTLNARDAAEWVIATHYSAPGADPNKTGQVNVNYLADGFKMPTEWKSNLALDIRVPDVDAILTLEGQWGFTAYDIHYVNQNLRLNTTGFFQGNLPDGREMYTNSTVGIDPFFRWREPGYRDVIELRNTSKGNSYQYTMMLQRPMKEHWSWRLGYTYSRAKTVTDGTSSSAYTNWISNVAFNPNDDTLGTSSFETRHRVLGMLTRELVWSQRHKTRVTLVYDGRSGRPFSFLGEYNLDLNGDGNNYNDLLYIPRDLDDPLVSWGNRDQYRNTEGVAFMAFVDSTPGLAQYKGQVVPRNTGRAPNIHQFDVNFTHEIRTWGRHRLELILNIQNVGNLINESWGLEKRPRGELGSSVNVMSQTRLIPRATDTKGNEYGYYVYRYRSLESRDFWYHPSGLSSRWAIQVGARYSF
jgi:hypothetical protein